MHKNIKVSDSDIYGFICIVYKIIYIYFLTSMAELYSAMPIGNLISAGSGRSQKSSGTAQGSD